MTNKIKLKQNLDYISYILKADKNEIIPYLCEYPKEIFNEYYKLFVDRLLEEINETSTYSALELIERTEGKLMLLFLLMPNSYVDILANSSNILPYEAKRLLEEVYRAEFEYLRPPKRINLKKIIIQIENEIDSIIYNLTRYVNRFGFYTVLSSLEDSKSYQIHRFIINYSDSYEYEDDFFII